MLGKLEVKELCFFEGIRGLSWPLWHRGSLVIVCVARGGRREGEGCISYIASPYHQDLGKYYTFYYLFERFFDVFILRFLVFCM